MEIQAYASPEMRVEAALLLAPDTTATPVLTQWARFPAEVRDACSLPGPVTPGEMDALATRVRGISDLAQPSATTLCRALLPDAWINDEVVNTLAAQLVSLYGNARSLGIVNTYACPFLESEQLAKADAYFVLPLPDLLLVPWHQPERAHWTLLVVRRVTRTVHLYDSLPGLGTGKPRFWRALCSVLGEAEGPWVFAGRVPGFPRQDDVTSCGIFMLHAMHALAGGEADATRFEQRAVPFLRVSYAVELVTNSIRPNIPPLTAGERLTLTTQCAGCGSQAGGAGLVVCAAWHGRAFCNGQCQRLFYSRITGIHL